jgi:hypothetical protein
MQALTRIIAGRSVQSGCKSRFYRRDRRDLRHRCTRAPRRLFVAADGFFNSRRGQFAILTARDKIRAAYFNRGFVAVSELMSYDFWTGIRVLALKSPPRYCLPMFVD